MRGKDGGREGGKVSKKGLQIQKYVRQTFIHPLTLSLPPSLPPYLRGEEQVGFHHGVRHGPGILLLREGEKEGGERKSKFQ